MVTRREFLQTVSAAYAIAASPATVFSASPNGKDEDPLQWVDVRIGTGGHGHCFPGAALPFGAVQLSPDTFNDKWDWCSGYHVSDTSIMGFSHTHLSGTGCGDLLDFLVMAGVGPVKLQPGSQANPEEGYRSRFSHEEEVAEPGYYSVLLHDPNVKAELTCTERTGLHRYTFPESQDAWLILDLSHSYLQKGSSSVTDAELKQDADGALSGGHTTSAWGAGRKAFFGLEVSRKPESVTLYSDDKQVDGKSVQGKNLKAVLHFKTKANEAILVRTGISGVSAEGALGNLKAEMPGWNFEDTRSKAKAKWREQLTRIRIQASEAHKKVFYTALYHLSLGPTLFCDADGQYRGMDNEIRTLGRGEKNYTTFSLWDTFRAAHPAYTLIQKERVPDFVNSLIRMAKQSPAGMPVWPLFATETGTMTGYHSASVIAEAICKGFPGINVEDAYACMMQRAMKDEYRGLGLYRKMGYIPSDLEAESISKTIEYCYADWAIAHVSTRLNKPQDAQVLRERSKNYRNYFNAKDSFMEPRLANGDWATPFSPIEMGHSKKWHDYTESNAWQTTFGIQHDPKGLIELFGGVEPFTSKLDALFTVPSDLPPDAPPDIDGLVGQYAHGNEPSHHIAYLYAYAGVPWKTQARVRSLMETMYRAEPNGMPGNEDVGQMSAWFLLSALGFYPVDPVSGNYILGSPLVDGAVVELGRGRQLTISVRRSKPDDVYVQSFTLNGKPQTKAWFSHAEIVEGGTLELALGPEPNRSFGAATESLPPSLS